MKFTNGYWLLREGFEVNYPRSVRDFEVVDDGLILYGPCKEIRHRGDTLNIPLLTIKLSSPIRNVIRMQTWHHKGTTDRKPNFDVKDGSSTFKVETNDNEIIFTTGELKAIIIRDSFFIEYYNGDKKLTHNESKGLAWVKGPENESYMRAQLNLSVGEYLYGLGERFTPFVKNGQVVDIWNRDGGTSSEQAYKNIPFYLSNKGYGVFVNHPEKVSFEVGSEAVSKTQFSVEGEELDYYMINGPSLKEVLGNYTELTGKPALPPAWSFGLWLSTSFTTNYDEQTVNHFVDEMINRDIPLSVFHFDCFWMKEFEWSSFEWDENVFPDPAGMLRRLKEKGLKISIWINPYIAQKSKIFDEAVSKGYLLKKPNGDVWQWDLWQAGMGIVDFTNPDACEWYTGKLKKLLDIGVDSFKTDFGERIPMDVVYADGSDPKKMRNYYSYKYNQIVFDLLRREKGENEAAVFARSATAGGQKFPVHWGGDNEGTYESMAESLRGGLSLTMSGFGYWSHDIGGFETFATPDLFKRWVAFGLLSSHSRLHGSHTYRVPWEYDEESVTVTSHFTKLKNKLMPYIFNASVENSKTGIPVMRSMVLEFKDDPATHTLDTQYMLGDSILVAPIFNEEHIGRYYLPKGKWTHLLSGKAVNGGEWKSEKYDYMSLPLYVRENTIIPIGENENQPDYDYANNVTFNLYQLKEDEKAKTTIHDLNGNLSATINATKSGDKITVDVKLKDNKPYSLVLKGFESISSVSTGTWSQESDGVRIQVEHSNEPIIITL
ncbi:MULTISPECIES: alpha-xylosidase [unclassified Oceanobacillus]|uniref:alpha-xylosidase n=1 Tax=unclassified Oceanobacillus TaxID=2630292 RepID=UPI00300E46BC